VNECTPLAAGFLAWFSFEGALGVRGVRHGLALVHFSAEPEPYLTRNTPFKPPTPLNNPRHLPITRKIAPKRTLNAPPIPQNALTLS